MKRGRWERLRDGDHGASECIHTSDLLELWRQFLNVNKIRFVPTESEQNAPSGLCPVCGTWLIAGQCSNRKPTSKDLQASIRKFDTIIKIRNKTAGIDEAIPEDLVPRMHGTGKIHCCCIRFEKIDFALFFPNRCTAKGVAGNRLRRRRTSIKYYAFPWNATIFSIGCGQQNNQNEHGRPSSQT